MLLPGDWSQAHIFTHESLININMSSSITVRWCNWHTVYKDIHICLQDNTSQCSQFHNFFPLLLPLWLFFSCLCFWVGDYLAALIGAESQPGISISKGPADIETGGGWWRTSVPAICQICLFVKKSLNITLHSIPFNKNCLNAPFHHNGSPCKGRILCFTTKTLVQLQLPN